MEVVRHSHPIPWDNSMAAPAQNMTKPTVKPTLGPLGRIASNSVATAGNMGQVMSPYDISGCSQRFAMCKLQ